MLKNIKSCNAFFVNENKSIDINLKINYNLICRNPLNLKKKNF